jgi:integrase/recombinase XerD
MLGRSDQTVSAYHQRVAAFLTFERCRGRHPLEADRDEIEAYHEALRARGVKRSSIAALLGTLRVFFRHAVRAGLIAAAPVIERPRVQMQPPVHVLSPRQVLRILAQPDVTRILGIRDRAILEVLYSTGVRNRELRALRVAGVDFAGGFIQVERGKGGKWRVVPVGRTALEWTRRYLDLVRPHLQPSRRHDVLFLSNRGGPMCSHHLNHMVVTYACAARVPFRVTTHSLRHAAATHLLRGDGKKRRAGLMDVRDILGHSTADATRIYTKVEITDLEQQVRARHFRDRRPREPR